MTRAWEILALLGESMMAAALRLQDKAVGAVKAQFKANVEFENSDFDGEQLTMSFSSQTVEAQEVLAVIQKALGTQFPTTMEDAGQEFRIFVRGFSS